MDIVKTTHVCGHEMATLPEDATPAEEPCHACKVAKLHCKICGRGFLPDEQIWGNSPDDVAHPDCAMLENRKPKFAIGQEVWRLTNPTDKKWITESTRVRDFREQPEGPPRYELESHVGVHDQENLFATKREAEIVASKWTGKEQRFLNGFDAQQ